MAQELRDALANLDENLVLDLVRRKIKAGEDPEAILADLKAGIEIIGQKFEAQELYLIDLIYSGDIFRGAFELIKPLLRKDRDSTGLGKFVLGTVKGDVHDIGKNIVADLLSGAGFEVIDLGVDIAPEIFAARVRETGSRFLGLSGLLTVAYDAMKETIRALEKAGLRDKVKVMIGGSMVNDEVKVYTGADAGCRDAVQGVKIAKEWAKSGHR